MKSAHEILQPGQDTTANSALSRQAAATASKIIEPCCGQLPERSADGASASRLVHGTLVLAVAAVAEERLASCAAPE